MATYDIEEDKGVYRVRMDYVAIYETGDRAEAIEHYKLYTQPLPWVYDDGGREAAGYTGKASDCVCRAISIACEIDYNTVYNAINEIAQGEHKGKGKGISNARKGVYKYTEAKYLTSLVWEWHATMGIGTGCTVHLRSGELPNGRIIARVSKHLVAVIDGIVHDTTNPSRGGMRCVYGYWSKGQ